MKTALMYPLEIVIFWYHDVGLGAIDYFTRLNSYLLHLFSVPLLFSTLFKPLKNEYRKGLVLFSIIFGLFLKSFLISVSIFFLIVFLIIELFIIAGIFILPFLLIYMVYAGKNIFQFI